ncbi:MAG TPA: type IV toxin-antitoxin system AbiEi family antitoxin domain-containing protein [Solirubrobacterales bacterium]|nr:type IV toxin-antitoxin system AbiEi family antitoxin domain-containing protein [Solirubrobacterales bacterium]
MAILAEAQYGVVSYRQLRELGFSKGHVYRGHEADRLRRVHRGVYAVGHAELSPHGRCRAALLAFNDNAVLSHRSAGWLWGLFSTCREEVDVTFAGKGRRSGIRIHRVMAISDLDTGTLQRIRVTSLPRTLFDIAASEPKRELERAVDRAKRRGLLDLYAIDQLLARRARVPGAAQLKQALVLYRKPVFDRARSELLFLDALEKEGERLPVLNSWVGEWEIDAYWEAERFAIEVDGWETHGSREAFESDRLRQEEMKLVGIDCIRISARRIETEPQQVARRIRALLAHRRETLKRTSL